MVRKALLLLILLLFSSSIAFNTHVSRTGMPTPEVGDSIGANALWVAKEYAIVNTRAAGSAVAVYGSTIAFFVVENATVITMYYDIANGNLASTNTSRHYPAIYADIITFSGFSVSYYNISIGETVDTGIRVVEDIPSIYKNIIAFPVYEAHSGDLNGDGDTSDSVVMYYDIEKKQLVNTGAAGWGVSVYEDIIAFSTFEYQVAEDLNGDGDADDCVVRYYNITSEAVVSTGANGWWLSMYKDIIAFESTYTTYFGITYYNISDGTLVNTKIDGRMASVYENIIAFSSPESDYGVGDLNGDGDAEDWVIGYYDISSKTWINTRVEGMDPSVHGNVVAFETPEESLGQDLNGDGDIADNVVRYFVMQPSPTFYIQDINAVCSNFGRMLSSPQWDPNMDMNDDGIVNMRDIGIACNNFRKES